MRLTIIIIIAVLSIGITVISLGYLSTPEYLDVPKIFNQYDKLEKYKNELKKINQYNKDILDHLKNQIKNSDDIHLDQINEEIEIIKQIIEKNKAELKQIITKLSQIESNP